MSLDDLDDEPRASMWWKLRRLFAELRALYNDQEHRSRYLHQLSLTAGELQQLRFDVARLSERLTYIERPDFDRAAGVGLFPRDPASQTEPERMRVREEAPSKRMGRKRRTP